LHPREPNEQLFLKESGEIVTSLLVRRLKFLGIARPG
jgi:hypothetical protein